MARLTKTLHSSKPYLLNLPCTDKRLASIFQLTLHLFFSFLALVPFPSLRRPSFQNAVVQTKQKPRWMMSMLTAIYYHQNQPWQKEEAKTKYCNQCEECSFEVQHALYWRYLPFVTKCVSLKTAVPDSSSQLPLRKQCIFIDEGK